ncbi:MAG: lipopolysaccharide biosynthesis protein [Bacteroidales bacterium]|nr:lipopolysaccharide biosynthesis protein [Bacteroidales bacterium]
MSGTAIAQAIPLAFSPVLSRIYNPEDFGAMAVFLSIYAIVTVIATLRLELTIIIPVKDEDAINIASLSVISSFVVGFFSLILIFFFENSVRDYFKYSDAGVTLYLIPFCIFLYGIYQNLYYWFNRKREFRQTSINIVAQSITSSVLKMAFGFINIFNGGLIYGTIAGQMLSAIMFITSFTKKYLNELRSVSATGMIRQWNRFYKLAVTLTFSHGLQGIYSQIPTLFIAKHFDLMTIGFVALSTKVVTLPISVISSAFGDVFRQKATEEYHRTGSFNNIFISTLKKTFAVSIVPFGLMFFFAPLLFGLVFGMEWLKAGEYLQIIIIGEFFAFIINPLDKASLIREKKKYIMGWNISRFISNGLIVLIAISYNLSVEDYLYLLAGINVLHYLIDLAACYRFSLGK